MRRILGALVLVLCLAAASASAATVTVVETCGIFSNLIDSSTGNNTTVSGSWTCEGANSIGAPSTVASITGFVVYDSDYSNGFYTPVTEQTSFTLSGFTSPMSAAWTADLVQTQGLGTSNTPVSETVGAGYNGATSIDSQVVLSGFYDNLTGLSNTIADDQSFTVGYNNVFTQGSAVQGTGYAQVVYTYTTNDTGTPEPASMALIGFGLCGIALVSRRLRTAPQSF